MPRFHDIACEWHPCSRRSGSSRNEAPNRTRQGAAESPPGQTELGSRSGSGQLHHPHISRNTDEGMSFASIGRMHSAGTDSPAGARRRNLAGFLAFAPCEFRLRAPRGLSATVSRTDAPSPVPYGGPPPFQSGRAESKNDLMSRSMTQSNFQQRSRAAPTASSADRPGRYP